MEEKKKYRVLEGAWDRGLIGKVYEGVGPDRDGDIRLTGCEADSDSGLRDIFVSQEDVVEAQEVREVQQYGKIEVTTEEVVTRETKITEVALRLTLEEARDLYLVLAGEMDAIDAETLDALSDDLEEVLDNA